MKRKILVLSIVLITFFGFSQEKNDVKDSYLKYFELPRESLFLHTNKTTYLVGEEIWFKVYTYDRKNSLSSKATTNIYLGVYDQTGKQVDKKIFLAKEGVAIGNIAVDSTFTSGNYYLKSSTNWMKNFREDDSYTQEIKIINPNSSETISKKITAKEYDIQFLPEGGYLLADVKNTVGIKAINDQGKGTLAVGTIFNSKGEIVSDFKTSVFGIGKFTFTPIKGEFYTAKIKLSNYKELEQKLPESEEVGMSMTINNMKTSQVVIELKLNQQSLKLFKGKEYSVFIHKDGKGKNIPFTLNNKQKRITIDKIALYKGVNTVTVFNEKNQPILERMFFNDYSLKTSSVVVSKKQINNDSITYQLASDLKLNQVIDASVSVLPKGTESYKPDHSIISSFYLRPYLKGAIENPQYYFTDFDRKKKYELDVLLLTQGWSRYSWDNIMYLPPKPNFDFENGITINGTLNTKLNKVKSLLLYPTEFNKSTFIPVDEKGKFHLKNFYPVKDEYIRFSYVDKKNKTKKPGIALSFLNYMQSDSIDVKIYENFISYYTNKNKSLKAFIDKKSEILDEIVLKASREKKIRRDYRLPFRGKLFHVDREAAERYIGLADFLNNNGFVVDNIGLNPTVLGQSAIRHNFARRGPVVVYLNNNQLADINIVINSSLDEYEDIYIDDTPNTNMASVNGGVATWVVVVKLFTRKTPLWDFEATSRVNSTKVKYGFQPKKKFYTPRYISYEMESFKKYGVIHWEPSIKIKNSEVFNLTTVNTKLDEVAFYIEGISSDGNLISQKIIVDKNDVE